MPRRCCWRLRARELATTRLGSNELAAKDQHERPHTPAKPYNDFSCCRVGKHIRAIVLDTGDQTRIDLFCDQILTQNKRT